MRYRNAFAALALCLVAFVGWTCIPMNDAESPEVLDHPSGVVLDALDGLATIINDAGTELAESQDCSYMAGELRRLCEFQVENLRESHARDLGDIWTQIDQLSEYIGSLTLGLYDSNGNERITCAEAKEAGITPVTKRHPAYVWMRDGDGDGVVCES